MKKSSLIFCTILVACCLTAFGYKNWSNNTLEKGMEKDKTGCTPPPACSPQADVESPFNFVKFMDEQWRPKFIYNVSSRFIHRVTKEQLVNAKTIIDILPAKATQSMGSYKNVEVSIVRNDKKVKTIIGKDERLTTAQLELLQSLDYATNISITAMSNESTATCRGGDYDLVYYMSIIPEQEAEFISGNNALIQYLAENSKSETAMVKENELKPGRIHFTVTKEGAIEAVKLTSTSGYSTVDETMLKLIENMSQKWRPAMDSEGKKVDQEMVYFFGIEGC